MRKHTVRAGQSVSDVALLAYGAVEGAFWLLADNPELAMADHLREGQTLLLRAERLNPRYAQYLADFAPIATLEPEQQAGGVGFYRLGTMRLAGGRRSTANVAPESNIILSDSHPTFINSYTLKEAVIPRPFAWNGSMGWNDGTEGVFPDWVELVWPQPMRLYGAVLVHLTEGLQPGDPGVPHSPYALRDFRFELWNGESYSTALSVTGNTRSYTAHDWPGYTTTRLRLWITATGDGQWSRLVQLQVFGHLF